MAVVVAEPLPRMAFVGKLVPAGPILLLEIVLLSLPLGVLASVLKNIVAPLVATDIVPEPCRLELVMVLLVAPPIKRMVEVPDVAETVVFAIVSEFPAVFNPLIVTLSAPFKSIIGAPAVVAPEMVRAAPPAGAIVMAV